MQKKVTITIEEEVYEGLHAVIGRGRISRFLEDLARPHVVSRDLEAAYREMAGDEVREAEADEWAKCLIGDVANATPDCTPQPLPVSVSVPDWAGWIIR